MMADGAVRNASGIWLMVLLVGALAAGWMPAARAGGAAGMTVGVLDQVDAAGRRIWMNDSLLPVAPGAEVILASGEPGSLFELKPGMRVRCLLERRDGALRVSALTVLPEGAPLLPPPPPELLERLREMGR